MGYEFDFVLEVHRGMTLPEAVTFGRAVEKYRPMVLEDPVPPDNMDTMAQVAAKVGVPIASGERFINLREFQVLLSRQAVQYVRPDVCAVGGITTSKKICLWLKHMMYWLFLTILWARFLPPPVCRSAPAFPTWESRSFRDSA